MIGKSWKEMDGMDVKWMAYMEKGEHLMRHGDICDHTKRSIGIGVPEITFSIERA